MPSTFTSGKGRLEKQAIGSNDGTWGNVLNDILDRIDALTSGYLEKDVAGGTDVTLTAEESRNAYIKFGGELTGNISVEVAEHPGWYIFENATTGDYTLTVKPVGGSGFVVPQGTKVFAFTDGSTIFPATRHIEGVLASTGSPNAYVLTPSPALDAYRTGDRISFRANFANTGAATLNISSLGAKSIKKMTASGKADLAPGDIQQGQPVTVEYDGTDMVMVTPVANQVRTDAANTFTADQTIRLTDNGSSTGPTLTLDRNSESPSASDSIGAIALRGRDSGGSAVTYANILGAIIDATAGAADGQLILQTLVNGSLQNTLLLRGGAVVGSPTGGDKGTGTLNASALYHNGVLVPSLPGMAKAWVQFNGTQAGPSLTFNGFNIASVTKNGTGDYTIAFNTPFANANYAMAGFAGSTDAGIGVPIIVTGQGSGGFSAQAGSVRLHTKTHDALAVNPTFVSLIFFGNQ